MLLTHSSLSHYSFGSVLLHRLLGRLGTDPTVEADRVKQEGGEDQLYHNVNHSENINYSSHDVDIMQNMQIRELLVIPGLNLKAISE